MSKKCKIILLLTLLIIFFKYQSLSQFSDRFGINLILSASRQNIEGFSKYYEDYDKYYQFKTDILHGMGIGIFYETFISHSISLCFNFEYVQRGFESYILIPNGVAYADEGKMYNKIDYLSLPIYAKIFFFNNNFNPYLFLGLRIDCMISYDSDYLQYYFNNANTFVYGSVAGIGCELKINEYLTLMPSIKYNFDFNNAIDQSDLKFKNSSLDFSLGVKIK